MLYERIFEKIGKNETLSPSELSEFMHFASQMQAGLHLLGGWTDTVGRPSLHSPIIERPAFSTSPLSALVANMQADLVVPNDTHTYIAFDEVYDESDVFSLQAGEQKITTNHSRHFMQFGGAVQWTANATGFRATYLEAFDESDVSLGSGIMHALPGFAGVENWFPYYFMFAPTDFPTLSYFKFRVYQNSGGDLTLKSFHTGVSIV
jgi:hypothetical protein